MARDLTFAICAETAGPVWAGKTPFDLDRRRQDRLVDCRGLGDSNPGTLQKVQNLPFLSQGSASGNVIVFIVFTSIVITIYYNKYIITSIVFLIS